MKLEHVTGALVALLCLTGMTVLIQRDQLRESEEGRTKWRESFNDCHENYMRATKDESTCVQELFEARSSRERCVDLNELIVRSWEQHVAIDERVCP